MTECVGEYIEFDLPGRLSIGQSGLFRFFWIIYATLEGNEGEWWNDSGWVFGQLNNVR